MRKMIINANDQEEVRIAILEGTALADFDIESKGSEKNKGNIYKAKVVAVEPSLNAAFINYGADKQGFLTASDVDPKLSFKKDLDPAKHHPIEDLLKPKQDLLVQINKDEVGAKGAVLTTHLSLAGRYVVLIPDSSRQGISRKIQNEDERKKIKEAAEKLNVPQGMGVIVRTAGKDRTKQELNRDLAVLLRLWENIQKESNKAKAPSLIFKEQDVVIRALRDYFTSDIDEIVVDNDDAYDRAAEYMNLVMPNQKSVLTRYVERRPIFHHYGIEQQLETIYQPKVTLSAGSSLVIEPTEALVSIDVNSGKQKSTSHEETATQTNMDAAREVARQLRLRDLGGIVVVDFIDMAQRKNQQRVEKVLRDAVKADKARIKVGRISRNGTLELTRQRIRTSVQSSMFTSCDICNGTGHILNPEAHAIATLRRLRDRASRGDLLSAKVKVEPEAANLLRTIMWPAVQAIESQYAIRIEILIEHSLQSGQDDFTFETNPDAVAIEPEAPNFGPAPIFDEDGNEIDPATLKKDAKSGEDGQAKKAKMSFELPSYKIIKPERLGYFKESGEETEDQAEPTGNRRNRRGRRGGRNRRGRDGASQATAAKAATGSERSNGRRRTKRTGDKATSAPRTSPAPVPTPPAPSGNKISRFFKRLFGG